ncbi:MAG TPA: cyclase family protein [Acidimicrobiia bacterium]|nr:cyclase family protein [Acidimicrobiia bacterium]
MAKRRVMFDFEIVFSNGGAIQGQAFRLDIPGDEVTDEEVADRIVHELNLLMVEKVVISNKSYVDEPHKRGRVAGGAGLVDLSHPIREGMITYPGIPGPTLRAHLTREDSRASYAEGTEFYIGAIEMVGNTGTYLDSPYHRYDDGVDLAGLPLERLVGLPGVVVDADETVIGPEVFADIETWGMAVLIRTGWDVRFGRDDYLGAHPHITEEAAQRLVDGGAALVGIDSANIDDTRGGTRPAHSLLLGAGIPLVEHLARLDQLPDGAFEFFAIPAPVVGLGTMPVRAVARWGRS